METVSLEVLLQIVNGFGIIAFLIWRIQKADSNHDVLIMLLERERSRTLDAIEEMATQVKPIRSEAEPQPQESKE